MELLLNTKFKIIHLWCTMNFSLNAVVFQTQLKAPLHSSAKLKKEVQNTHFFLSLLFFSFVFSSCTVTKYGSSYYPQRVICWVSDKKLLPASSLRRFFLPLHATLESMNRRYIFVASLFVYCFNNWSENFVFDYLACANTFFFNKSKYIFSVMYIYKYSTLVFKSIWYQIQKVEQEK